MTSSLVERAVEVAVLGGVAWPMFAPCASREFWRAFPTFARVLWALLAAYAAGVVMVALMAPSWLLRWLAVIGVGVLLAVQWHSVASRGRARRWPPGSLRPLSLGPWFGRTFFLDQYRRFGSPFKTSQFVRPMACLVGLPNGFDFLRDHEASLGSPPVPFSRFIPGGFLRWMSPDRHLATKEAFRAALVREVYEPLAPFMRATIRAELVRMAEASAGSDGQGVPPRRHIQRMVFAIWMRLFFHVEPDRPELQQLKALYGIIDMRNPTGASDRAVRAALAAISQVLRERLATMDPAGPPASFLEALVRSHARAVEDQGVLLNVVYMAHTTWSDVSGLLQWLFRMLTEHPEWTGRLRSDDPDGSSLSTRIVMETLRLEQSEQLYRVANRDIEHEGFSIPRGWLVRVCLRESHQDPAVFENPRAFDPDRFLGRSYARHEYSPFGAGGRHACLGEGLTKVVGRLFTDELARGFAWRTVSDGPYEYSAWRHWRPGSSWRVLVTSRQ